jgi:DNA repair protein RadC
MHGLECTIKKVKKMKETIKNKFFLEAKEYEINENSQHLSLKELKSSLQPREKLSRFGSESLSTSELLALILGRGTKNKSVHLLAKEISDFLETQPRLPSLETLLKIKGLGPAKASQVLAALELSGRFLLSGVKVEVTSPEKVLNVLSFLKNAMQEHFVMISLDSANHIIEVHTLTIGLANQTQIHPREAFVRAIENRAIGVIFAHNHPSGNLKPSMEDLNITKRLSEAGRLLSIPVLDHIIVSVSGFTSLKRESPHLFED